MSEANKSVVLIMKPGKSAEKVLVDNISMLIYDILGNNIHYIEFQDVLILYDANARSQGKQMNSIISGETIIGNIICLERVEPIPTGLNDDRANELLKFSCFEKPQPLTLSKFNC